jgi:Spy/CpxP family protein refolding chaperone
MDVANKRKWQVRIAALCIFLLGFAAGALALNAYRKWERSNDRRPGLDQVLSNLQLNEDQKTQVAQILGDTRQQLQALRKESEPRFAEIRRQADERLQKVLTPDQWKQFQQERDKTRSRNRRGRGYGSGSPELQH